MIGWKDDGKIEVSSSTSGQLRLTVRHLEPSDSARYTCSASSDDNLGTHEMTAAIRVHCKNFIIYLNYISYVNFLSLFQLI